MPLPTVKEAIELVGGTQDSEGKKVTAKTIREHAVANDRGAQAALAVYRKRKGISAPKGESK